MINYIGKRFLTLPEQVAKNKDDIDILETSINTLPIMTSLTSTISIADWNLGTTVTKTVVGVTANSIVWVSPTSASRAKVIEFDVYSSSQDVDELTFVSSLTPDADIIFNIVIGGE